MTTIGSTTRLTMRDVQGIRVVFAVSTADGTGSAPDAFLGLGLAADDALGEAIERSVAP